MKMKNSLIILFFFVFGIILGAQNEIIQSIDNVQIATYVLYGLLFFVGVSLGLDPNLKKIVEKANLKMFLIPLGTILGSYIGVLFINFFLLKMNVRELLSVSSGFGYYSLSSIIITGIKGETLGTIALISNLSREIITLLFAPVFVKLFGKISPILSGGATSMDSTLPVILKYSGRDVAILSLFNGISLTVLVPFLVTILLSI